MQSSSSVILATLCERDGSPLGIIERPGAKAVEQFRITKPIEIGRQNEREGHLPPGSCVTHEGKTRWIVADIHRKSISRNHLQITPQANAVVSCVNLSKGQIRVEGYPALNAQEAREFPLPVELWVGELKLRLAVAVPDEPVMSLPNSSLLLSRNMNLARSFAADASIRAEGGTLDNESLMNWVQAILGVLQEAAGTLDFYPRAARAVVDMIGLDSGRVLIREGGNWVVRALQTAGRATADDEWRPSRAILQRVLQEKKSCFMQSPGLTSPEMSLADVGAVVASPIFDRGSEIVGVLYGERRGMLARRGISRLEVLLVELLAGGIAVGQARVAQEDKATRAQVQMEQFFTKEIAKHLAEHPEELRGGRDLEVTMLSCDIRGFSRICERLKDQPDQTLLWLNTVLGALSRCVLDEQGVLVDYVGDELMNMWGAPGDQPDHARRACSAALAMLEQVPRLNQDWHRIVQENMGVRVGLNSGPARVGNVGSDIKFKYGALGNNINLTSRVQGAAKYLRTSLVITEATQRQLDARFATRRLAQVRVINIEKPVTIYELVPLNQTGWDELRRHYEEALAAFESGNFRSATHLLGDLLSRAPYRDDGPSLVLMQRAINALVEDSKDFSPIWELPSK